MDPEEIRRRIDALVEALLKELRQIDAEAGQKREAAIARSGLPQDFLRSVLGDSPLPSGHSSVTVDPMSSTEIVTKRHPGPVASGPMGKLAKEYGFSSLADLAAELGVTHEAIRAWNRADRGLPDAAREAIDKMRLRLDRPKAKRKA